MNLKDKIAFFHEKFYASNKNYRFANNVELNGIILNKPRKIEALNGQEMYVFALLQVKSGGKYKFYVCQAKAFAIKETLDNMECATFVSVLGSLYRMKYGEYRVQIEEMKVNYDFPTIPLEKTYENKESCENDELE